MATDDHELVVCCHLLPTALVWKVLMVSQSRFRRLDAPQLLAEVHHGVSYVAGHRLSGEKGPRVAA